MNSDNRSTLVYITERVYVGVNFENFKMAYWVYFLFDCGLSTDRRH
jgi:hypothetical protein